MVSREKVLNVMSSQPWPAEETRGHQYTPAKPPAVAGVRGTHQPWRAALAGLELIIGVALVLAAWWAWQHGTVTIVLPAPGGAVDVVTRSVGSWLAAAVAAVTLAALLLIDAIRQVPLAIRVRRPR